jgi:hypothetical protein
VHPVRGDRRPCVQSSTVMTLAFATRGPIGLAAAVIGTPLSKTVGPMPFLVAIGGMRLFVAAGSRSRTAWVVTTAATFELILAVPWTLLVLVLTVPCGLSGTGILEPSAGCPVSGLARTLLDRLRRAIRKQHGHGQRARPLRHCKAATLRARGVLLED